jgi:hypothetical protein
MNSSDLNKLLFGISSGEDLQRIIQKETSFYYQLLMEKKGSSFSLKFNEDEEINLDGSAIKILLHEALSGRLSSVQLAYICDCLTLGEKVLFLDEMVEDIVHSIADPEINGGFKSDAELRTIIVNFERNK